MNQQQKSFEERVEQWASVNGFKLDRIDGKEVHFNRVSDSYPIKANVRLLDNIMRDEGF